MAQALADVASIALIQERSATDSDAVNAQLQGALSSRVVLEQAKRILAAQGGLDMAEAHRALRRYARERDDPLSEVAQAFVSWALPVDAVPQAARTQD